MNDGDPSRPQRGRAQVPGSSGNFGASAGGISSGDAPATGGTGTPAGRARVGGRASVGGASGSASVGSASVGGASVGGASGSASVGSAKVGRASVGRAGAPGADGGAGRARVPVQTGAAGRASVGRAGMGVASPDDAARQLGGDVIENRGSSGRPPKGPSSAAAARAKRARRRNWILGSFALLIMISGGTVVAGTYFYDNVDLPSDLPQRAQATTVYYADNKTQMAKFGDENRTIVTSEQIPDHVKHAVVATENKDFYTDEGISYTGILRAAWNNFTGGQRQGASTITQQYARQIADLKGITYSRKLREAVLAMKLNKKYSKDQILVAYLNTVPFGRNTYGIEAAAQSYFGKHAKELTVAEGMALAAMIKDPAGGPGQLSLYDGSVSPGPANDRFNNYVKLNMVKMKFLPADQAATLKYPEIKPYDPTDPALAPEWGLDKPTGNVLHNVVDELTHLKDVKGNNLFSDLRTGGYRIVTTIDPNMQKAAEQYGSGEAKDSPLATAKAPPVDGQENKVGAAIVSVEPFSGRVKAYYGGPSGGQPDLAGVWRDSVLTPPCPKDEPNCDRDRLQGFGRHVPASSFKIYTLGAALKEGYSLNTYWDGTSGTKFPGREKPVVNAEGNTACAGGDKHCTLAEATVESLNVPFYALASQIKPEKVVDFAQAAGIRYMWNTELPADKQRFELAVKKPSLSPEVGIGQYPVTVLDHANGVATLAARGARAQVHFVAKVEKAGDLIYSESFKPTQIPGFTKEMADAATSALVKVLQTGTGKGNALAGNRQAAAKTGTWQAEVPGQAKSDQNSNAWMVGYIAPDLSKKFYGLATAVWMGATKGDSSPVTLNKGKSPMFGSTGPGKIWKPYMDAATAGMPKTTFPSAKDVGDDSLGNAQPPTAPANNDPNAGQPGNQNCPIPIFCPGGGQNNQNNQNNQPGQPTQPGGQAGGRNGGNGNGNGNGGQGGGSPVADSPAVLPTRRP
ncbi:transglycosylase domain-containing protein [Planosporangium sp. 12N6]|uniref:transglycosylase domain-containing protein n=1 Tax=Planosporangium spinosum TaxID=3402278 RepID=UPI003CF874AA